MPKVETKYDITVRRSEGPDSRLLLIRLSNPDRQFHVEVRGTIDDAVEAFGALIERWKGQADPPLFEGAEPVDFENLADVLTQSGTLLRLANLSQIHLQS
jgi:hypothetical protein